MAEIHIPYLPSAKFFKIRCRLGIHEQDIAGDDDSDPQIRTIGGTVTIATSVKRFRYTEADGRTRVVYNKTETYNIQTATGELFDADGNLGVYLLDTTSPGVDPQGWTYRATIRPEGGEPFDVVIPSGWTGEAFDLGDGLVFSPSTGITDLEIRVKALEDAGSSSGGSGTSWNDIADKPSEFAPSEHRHDASAIDNLPAGGGSSTIIADDTPAAPAEGESASYLVTSAVTWPAGLVWSTDPDGGVAPAITGTALVSMFTLGGTTRAILGATFPGVVVPDTTAPSTVTGFTANATGPTTVDLAWSAATDNVGVTGYEYRINGGAAVDAGAGTTETVTGLTAGTAYSFEVRAYDAAGNRSAAWSASAIATTTAPDTTPPVWTATLTPGTPTATSVVITASALATDANAVTYERTLDSAAGTPVWAAIVPSGLDFTLDNLTAGTVYANCALRAKDAAGNISTPVLAVPSFTTEASATPLPVTAGLVGHWDPSDAATRTVTGVSLTQLADKSGGSRHLVKHADQSAPQLGALNGLTAMSFDQARLIDTSGFPMSGTGDSYTLAFVATPSSVASAYLLEFGVARSTRDAVISNYGGKSFERYADGSSTTRYDIAASAPGHHVITITRSASAWSSTLDGVAAGSGSGALAAIAAPSLWVGGSNVLTADHATATIGEIVLYDTALSAGDLDLVENYLKTKWGVA